MARVGPQRHKKKNIYIYNSADRPRGQPSDLYNRYRVFSGCKGGGGVVLTTHSSLSPTMQMGCSYTSASPLWLHSHVMR